MEKYLWIVKSRGLLNAPLRYVVCLQKMFVIGKTKKILDKVTNQWQRLFDGSDYKSV